MIHLYLVLRLWEVAAGAAEGAMVQMVVREAAAAVLPLPPVGPAQQDRVIAEVMVRIVMNKMPVVEEGLVLGGPMVPTISQFQTAALVFKVILMATTSIMPPAAAVRSMIIHIGLEMVA
jgi:hypothetical protein